MWLALSWPLTHLPDMGKLGRELFKALSRATHRARCGVGVAFGVPLLASSKPRNVGNQTVHFLSCLPPARFPPMQLPVPAFCWHQDLCR